MSGLTIYRASAGSGKTFAITREYIHLLFIDPENFRRILGVTFTNKATAEMKGRILNELDKLSRGLQSDYAFELMKDFNLDLPTLKKRASYIILRVLHDYSHFNILTIDSFFQRIIRAFTREIGFYRGFEVELDQHRILKIAIDQMFFELDSNPRLKDWLVRFAEDRILEGSNWNVSREIENLGEEVFKEKFNDVGDQLFEKITDKLFLNDYAKSLHLIQTTFESGLRQKGKDAVEIIKLHHLTNDKFKGKSRSIGTFFENLSLREKFNDWKITSTIQNHYNNIEPWLGTDRLSNQNIEKAYYEGLNKMLGEIVDISNTQLPIYLSALEIQKHIYILGVVSDLLKHIRDYTSEKNLFMISDTSRFLNKLIGISDVPFVYERIGTFIRHFMIDEFQDTSALQWKNFQPLVINSLAEGYNNWIVGDVKQSIYRWRNSDWTILSDKIFDDLKEFQLNVKPLDYNWRSNFQIVCFNNSFFKNAVSVLLNEVKSTVEPDEEKDLMDFERLLSNAYTNFTQFVPDRKLKEGGFIRIEFITKDINQEHKFQEQSLEKIPFILEQLQDQGYSLKDMAILVRTRSEGNMVSEFLLKHQKKQHNLYRYDVLSNDSLLLKNSEVIKWMISIFQYIVEPDVTLNNAFIAYEYGEYINPSLNNQFLHYYFSDNEVSQMSRILEDFVQLKNLRQYSVFELSNKLVHHFKLYELTGEIPFIQAFQDIIHEYSKKEPVDVSSFLNWWEENCGNKVISMPQDQDAIHLMTLHTAKGLEFKIVIIPFADWTLMKSGYNSDILWCSPQTAPFNNLELIPVTLTKGLQKTVFRGDYFREKALSYVDNLNLLYVAFTRAIEGLYVLAPESDKSSVENHMNNLLSLAIGANSFNPSDVEFPGILLTDYWDEVKNTFSYGKLPEKTEEYRSEISNIPLEELHFIPREVTSVAWQIIQSNDYLSDYDERLLSATNSGKIMHEIFQKIKTKEDIEKALLDILLEGKITETERKELNPYLHKLLDQPKIHSWFSSEWEILTEASILLEDGSALRPDRVLIKDLKAIVIDYKFGKLEQESHSVQVRNYMKHLRKMNYNFIEGFIWYVQLDIIKPVEEDHG